jgi:hypothetical protein
VTWTGVPASTLERAGVPFRTLEAVVGEAGLAGAEAAGRAWARVWGRLPLAEGRSFRDLVEWRGASLLWVAEGFIRERTTGPRLARAADLGLRLIEALAPSEIDAFGLSAADALLLARAASTEGVLFHDPPATASPLHLPSASTRGGLLGVLGRIFPQGQLPSLSPYVDASAGRDPVLVLGPGPTQASVIRPLLEAVATELGLPSVVLPTAQVSRWATARVHRATAEAERILRARLVSLRGSPGLLLSYAHRGVGFADLAAEDLEALLLGHLPAMVSLLEAAIELVSATRPALMLLAVPEPDERRALVFAARAAGIPAVTLRVGAPEPIDAVRQDGGPQPAAQVAWEPGTSTQEVVARLREVPHGRVEAR